MIALLLSAVLTEGAAQKLGVDYAKPLGTQAELSLASDRLEYYVKEPIQLTMRLKNVGHSLLRGFFVADPLSPKAKIYYRRSGFAASVFPYPGPKGGYVDKFVMLAPEEELEGIATLAFDSARQSFVFTDPGQYEFQVVYWDAPDQANARLESDVVTVRVEPAPEKERDAAASYSRELALVAQDELGFHLGSVETIAAWRFVERFPNSTYSIRLREGLARVLRARVIKKWATDEEREIYVKLEAAVPPGK